MDKRVLRERMRRKKRQMMIRRITRLVMMAGGVVLVLIFVVRGVIFPIVRSIGGKEPSETTPVQAQTAEADPDAAIRQPIFGKGDVTKATELTPGWHDDKNGRWYQNADNTFYASGFQEIDGTTYYFNDNGYLQTGWVSKGVKDYYFNDDGSYNPEKIKPRLALTFDDGPGVYTEELLDCLEENNAHATFFMQGQNVELYPDTVKRMAEIGCEIGTHSWNHPNLFELSMDQVAKQFTDTDNALIKACGQPATVARAPFGNGNQEIFDTVQKPFFMWSLDTLDWQLKDEEADYNAVMNGDLTDGSIILMHDIHEPSVKAALRIIPDLIAKGYKLVTVSELAEAKDVELQNASYVDFWDSSLANGIVPGYKGDLASSSEDETGESLSDGTQDGEVSDGSEEGELSDGSEDSGGGELTDGE